MTQWEFMNVDYVSYLLWLLMLGFIKNEIKTSTIVFLVQFFAQIIEGKNKIVTRNGYKHFQ